MPPDSLFITSPFCPNPQNFDNGSQIPSPSSMRCFGSLFSVLPLQGLKPNLLDLFSTPMRFVKNFPGLFCSCSISNLVEIGYINTLVQHAWTKACHPSSCSLCGSPSMHLRLPHLVLGSLPSWFPACPGCQIAPLSEFAIYPSSWWQELATANGGFSLNPS